MPAGATSPTPLGFLWVEGVHVLWMVLVSHLLFTLLKEVPLTTLCVRKCHSRMLKHSSISSLFDLLKRFIFPLVLPFELIIPFLGIHPKELSSNIENTFVQIFFFFTSFFLTLMYSGRKWLSKAVRAGSSHSFTNLT